MLAFFVVVVPEMGLEQHEGEQIIIIFLTESSRHFRFVSNMKQRKTYYCLKLSISTEK